MANPGDIKNTASLNGIAKRSVWILLTALLSIFITVTYGKADGADKKAQQNITDIQVMAGKIESNQALLIEKMNSMLTQQSAGFTAMKDRITDINDDINRYHKSP